MEDGARRRSASQPSRRTRWISADDLLEAAERACAAAQDEGTIVYRQCRANQWQFFRKKCIDLRGRLNMASAEQYDALRAQVDAYCEAEQRYHRSEEHTSELQSLMRISYAVFCLKKTHT